MTRPRKSGRRSKRLARSERRGTRRVNAGRGAPAGPGGQTRLSRSARAVARALREFERAHNALSARGTDLLAVVHRLWAEAAEAERSAILRELADLFMLRDLAALKEGFALAPPGSLPEDIERLRTLPSAALDWISRRFDVVPHMDVGQKLEVPQSALGKFTFEGNPPPKELALLKLSVVAPGWKCRGTVLVPPTVQWLAR